MVQFLSWFCSYKRFVMIFFAQILPGTVITGQTEGLKGGFKEWMAGWVGGRRDGWIGG